MSIVRREIDLNEEKRILISAITDTEFIMRIKKKCNPKFFRTKYAPEILKWCFDYYDEYGEAPNKQIQEIFDDKKINVSKEKLGPIEIFLSDLSEKFESTDLKSTQYYVTQAKKYFEQRSIEVLLSGVNDLIIAGKIDEARTAVEEYKSNPDDVLKSDDLFDDGLLESYLVDQEEHGLFKLRGDVGRFLGSFQRGWLVGIMGAAKTGKSAWLQEIAVQCLENKGLKLLFVSLEMIQKDTFTRYARRITGMSTNKDDDLFIPSFDCVNNQTGECRNRNRVNKVTAYNDVGELKSLDKLKKYKPCTYCKDNKEKGYSMSVWRTSIKNTKNDYKEGKKRIAKFRKTFNAKGRARILHLPILDGTLDNIENEIRRLIMDEEFLPDVIIIDYADIIAITSRYKDDRDKSNIVWQSLKRMAVKQNCVVITASQLNRDGFEKHTPDSKSVSEDIRKTHTADVIIALAQSKKRGYNEKDFGIMRLSLMFHRNKGTSEAKEAVVLQQIATGQVCIDSMIWNGSKIMLPNSFSQEILED